MKMHDFVKIVGSLTLASIDILVPACFVMAISSHHKVAAIVLGVAVFVQWIREAIITHLMSEDKIA
jgi:hypothetical protein